METKEERIQAAKKFAEGLDNLFKDFYKDHEPSFMISISAENIDNTGIPVHNGLFYVVLVDAAKGFIPLQAL